MDDDSMPEPDRVVIVDGAKVPLYAGGRGPHRRYWPTPFDDPWAAPWHLRPRRGGFSKKWIVVRCGRRGRRDRYLDADTVEGAVAKALSDEKGW